MNKLQTFYSKTYYFWTFSRFFLAIAFSLSVLEMSKNLKLISNIIGAGLMSIYILVSIWILIEEIFKKLKASRIMKYFSGGFLIVASIVLIVMIIHFSVIDGDFESLPILIVPLWIILLGLKDLLTHSES